jgi:CheY-like chemotaxis protein
MRRTILLADDSLTIHRLVNNTFADADFEIVSVSNGEAAIRKFEEIHPHVVLADIYMPGKTGYEVCTYIRQHPAVSSTPVILLVGAFDAFDENKAKEIGANGHITKPFEPRSLFSLIETLLPPEEEKQDETASPAPVTLEEPVRSEAKIEVKPETKASVEAQASSQGKSDEVEGEDLLGLKTLFTAPVQNSLDITSLDIDRIADRVIQRISSQIIESIAWDVVPDIAEKVVREEVKRTHES